MRKLVWLVVVTACGGASKPATTKSDAKEERAREAEEPARETGIIQALDNSSPVVGRGNPDGGDGAPGGGEGSAGGKPGGGGDGDAEPKAAAPKRAAMGSPTTTGDLDKAIIRRYIRRTMDKITACYEQELAKHPALAGTLNVQFTIEANGSVSSASASGVAGIAECVSKIVREIQFPNPKGGGTVKVTYPFTFRPDGT